MYCVVETIEHGSRYCTAVPKKWLLKNKTSTILCWLKKRSAISTKGRKSAPTPTNDWEHLKCKIICDNIGKFFIIKCGFIFFLNQMVFFRFIRSGS